MDYIYAMAKIRNIDTLSVDSSVLCCNFVNTVSSWKVTGSHDYLVDYDSFLAWCHKLRVCSPGFLESLRDRGQDQERARALETIKEVRSLVHRLIVSINLGDTARTGLLLSELEPWLREAGSRERLEFVDGRFRLGLHQAPDELLAPLWPVIHSLKGLLTQNDPDRIKECPKCGWVFLDGTKNGRRKWCSPQTCGSTDKMERYNRRKRESRAQGHGNR